MDCRQPVFSIAGNADEWLVGMLLKSDCLFKSKYLSILTERPSERFRAFRRPFQSLKLNRMVLYRHRSTDYGIDSDCCDVRH